MKRVYLILTLFMTSFFFFSTGVKASTYELTITEDSMSYIHDGFFKVRDFALQYCEENEIKYYIITASGSVTNTTFTVSFFNEPTSYSAKYNSTMIAISYYFTIDTTIQYNLNNEGEIISNKTVSSFGSLLSINSTNNTIDFKPYLDTNFNLLITSNDVFIISYRDYTSTSQKNERFLTLYDYYLVFNKPEEVNPKSEVVTNFYLLVIDKIKLLTNYIATDYIILSALVIFIFVAVIGLVRRLK